MHGIRQFVILTRMTALEAIRQPVCLLLTMTCVLATVSVPLFLMYNFGEGGKMARDGGLAFHLLFGLFIAVHAAASALSREIRSGTASAILSKPVSRETFFLAKFAGVALVIAAFSLAAIMSTMLATRAAETFVMKGSLVGFVMDWRTGGLLALAPPAACGVAALLNYLRRRSFNSSAFAALLGFISLVFIYSLCVDRHGHFAPLDADIQWNIVPAGILTTLALLMLASFAVAVSARLGALPTLTICAAILLAGLSADYLFEGDTLPGQLVALLRALIPNWQHFWMADALNAGGHVPWAYVAAAAFYALLYTGAILCLGLLSFRHAEMK